MTETAKTVTFVAVAAAAALLAIFARPSLPGSSLEDVRNQLLYPDFKDPLAVTSLEIVDFDEQRGELIPFKVAQVEVKGKTRWSIPSHDNYPADAKDQVASAAVGLMGLKVVEMVSEDEGDQREYGVIEPNPKSLKMGATGVGRKVVMTDASGKKLLELIIGKTVPDQPNLRYVRKVDESPIYVVEAKTDKLSTKFENWIERNLLQISTLDVKQLWVRDYSVDVINGEINQRNEMKLEYSDSGEPKWKMLEDRKLVGDPEKQTATWAPIKMSDKEELHTAKLDELLNALGDLKIVDISRKPAGLSADLKAAGDFASNREAVQSLGRKGFFVAKLEGQVELFSNEGEIHVSTKEGVDYILRFGQIAGSGPAAKDEKSKDTEKGKNKDEKDKKDGGLNRYLFVMAEFDPTMIPKPQLESVPEAKKEEAKKEIEKKPADDKKGGEAKPEEKKADDKKAGEANPEEKKAGEKAAETKKPDDKKVDEAERQRIEKDNKRKLEEYDQKIAEGKKRVGELNARFADWYYVISEDVYRKIHLGRDEIITKKEAAKDKGKASKDSQAGFGSGEAKDELPASALEMLKEEGPGGK